MIIWLNLFTTCYYDQNYGPNYENKTQVVLNLSYPFRSIRQVSTAPIK